MCHKSFDAKIAMEIALWGGEGAILEMSNRSYTWDEKKTEDTKQQISKENKGKGNSKFDKGHINDWLSKHFLGYGELWSS